MLQRQTPTLGHRGDQDGIFYAGELDADRAGVASRLRTDTDMRTDNCIPRWGVSLKASIYSEYGAV